MKIKKSYVYAGIVILVMLAGIVFYFKFQIMNPKKPVEKNETGKLAWFVDREGYLYYPLDRGKIKFRRDIYSETNGLAISKIVYQSARGNVYGLLALPKNISEQLPGVILLPGAGVSKENELKLAEKIAELGAAVLTIDQRGVGETNGDFPSLEQDYANFLQAKEPVQHLIVYDALKAYDLLYSAPFVDPDRIIIAGESLGGRIAIIAAAIDRNIKGVLVISSAGLDFAMTNDTKVNAFLNSIDSDHYIDVIAPRKLVIMHNLNDKVIPLSSAVNSYQKAQEPKRFVLVNDTSCNHGYCDSMYDGLVESLDYLVEIKSKTIVSVPME